MTRPRIGYARLVIARNVPNHSTIPDSNTVIYLGHKAEQPLIGPPSELVDRSEPHGLIRSTDPNLVHDGSAGGWGGGVPGVVRQVGTGRGAIPGTSLRPI